MLPVDWLGIFRVYLELTSLLQHSEQLYSLYLVLIVVGRGPSLCIDLNAVYFRSSFRWLDLQRKLLHH